MALLMGKLIDPAFLRRLERLDLRVRRLVQGDRRGESVSRRRGMGTIFREFRPYVPGDDPRFLDWSAWLRWDRLQVRVFEAEEAPRLILLVDRSASMGLRSDAKLHQGLRLAAALGALGLQRHLGVTLGLFPGPEITHYRGRLGLLHLLRRLETVEAQGVGGFREAAQRAVPSSGARGLAVMVSDFYDATDFSAALKYFRSRGFSTHGAHVLDPADLAVMPGDRVQLVDVETGRTLRERIDRRTVQLYRDVVLAQRESVEATCRRHQVLYTRTSVGESLESTVMDLVRRGAAAW